MRALVANDPRVYRELIADALVRLRPLVEVSAAEPEELEREVERVRPHLVISSRATNAEERAGCLRWVVLYPNCENRVEIYEGGAGGRAVRLLEGVGVTDLLSVVDETELFRGSEQDSRATAR